ncbi:MAG: DUF1080 domain-containing protein [Vicinamibacterales bacterium]
MTRNHVGRTALAAALATAVLMGAPAMSADQTSSDDWRPLFDGKSLAGWRGYKTPTPPAGWQAVDGDLVRNGPGGDLMTVDEFGDFELELEWKVGPGGNSGIMYRVATGAELPWHSGPEFQVLDNARHADGKNPLTSAGSNYAVHAPVRDVTRPVGEWNAVRLVVRGDHVEHWLNGVKLLEYELGSPDWTARVKASKFATLPGYGRARRGHLVLQDHGDVVSFRRIRIRTH